MDPNNRRNGACAASEVTRRLDIDALSALRPTADIQSDVFEVFAAITLPDGDVMYVYTRQRWARGIGDSRRSAVGVEHHDATFPGRTDESDPLDV